MTPALALDPFAPLSAGEIGDTSSYAIGGAEHFFPIVPVPNDAPPAQFIHPKFGEASATWSYRDDLGRLLGHVARFETASGKTILPRTWCRLPDGSEHWHWKSFATPRPLYGLDRLAQAPHARVLVVEGEKAADAAQTRLADYVAVSWPGGSNAVAKADWRVLAGRRVVIWPDKDQPGLRAAEKVAKLAMEAGATSVCLVSLPGTLPKGWDLADPVPDGIDIHDLLQSAREFAAGTQIPDGYIMSDEGLVWRNPSDAAKPDLLVAGPFGVLAETRDGEGFAWGVLCPSSDNLSQLAA